MKKHILYGCFCFFNILIIASSYAGKPPSSDQELRSRQLGAAAAFARALAGVDLTLKLSANQCDWQQEIKMVNTWFERDQEFGAAAEKLYQTSTDKRSVDTSPEFQALVAQNRVNRPALEAEVAAFVDRCGWPRKDEFGPRAGQAIALVIQHAGLEIQKKYLAVMIEAAKTGNLDTQSVGLLIDRIRLKLGLKQIYGSQLIIVDGKDLVYPIEDEANVNNRRRAFEFYPVSWCAYLWLFDLETMPKSCLVQQSGIKPK
jgi:hypothetical protein